MANRDLKNGSRATTSRRPARKGSNGGGLWTGLLLGLIIGVASIGGVVWYLNKSPRQTTAKAPQTASAGVAESAAELLAPGTRLMNKDASADAGSAPAPVVQPPATPQASQPAAKPVTPPADKSAKGKDGQRFDFYKILPGNGDAVAPQPEGSAKSSQEPNASSAAKSVWLQLGSFQNQDDADNMKAKLAMVGVEAKIQSVTLPGKGMVHRVRVGPFSRPEDMERLRSQLKADGINATAVRMDN
ncbi:SPOR domain-containing protein [Paludibacterium paludis]|uniref:Cell division protein n=1 Tax=Paludibacterium paludis TaxID=1225769 RepID=A0A918NZC7_9NEIS|nr:SPOR domain-containing protein [Paludibacterium paludis]GGY08295.1 cell division protein [Paludibacterium paludis]